MFFIHPHPSWQSLRWLPASHGLTPFGHRVSLPSHAEAIDDLPRSHDWRGRDGGCDRRRPAGVAVRVSGSEFLLSPTSLVACICVRVGPLFCGGIGSIVYASSEAIGWV